MSFKWKKLGRLFNPASIEGRPWLHEFAQAPATLIFDDFVRIYFSCRPKAETDGQYVSYSAYIDVKRDNLFDIMNIAERPILPLGGLGTFDQFGTYPASVCKFENEFRVYYGGWTRCDSVPFNVAIGVGISNDNGKTFIKTGAGPVLSYSVNEPFILSGPKIRRFNNKWYLFYIAGRKWVLDKDKPEPVYKIRSAVSEDGYNWIKTGTDLIESRIEANEAQASPDVLFLNGVYHMFFCYRFSTGYRSHEKGYRIGYASSTDLLHWKRDDAKAGITVSEDGWDSEMVSYPHVFQLDNKVYMLYLGNQVGRYGFGLAEMINSPISNTQ